MRRHKAESGYPRGEETRAKIIRTAISLFGEKGFAGVSTREIATAAGVPAPSLQYYFENKEGLYRACMEDIHAAASDAVAPAIAKADELLAGQASAESLIDAYCMVLESMADFLFDAPDATSRALFIAQQRLTSHPASMKPENKRTVGLRIQDCCAAVITRIAKGQLSDDEVRIASITINGQLFIVHLIREHVKDLIGWDEFTSARVDDLKKMIRRQTTVILNSYQR
jgi:AcrR family transcriptional regulator